MLRRPGLRVGGRCSPVAGSPARGPAPCAACRRFRLREPSGRRGGAGAAPRPEPGRRRLPGWLRPGGGARHPAGRSGTALPGGCGGAAAPRPSALSRGQEAQRGGYLRTRTCLPGVALSFLLSVTALLHLRGCGSSFLMLKERRRGGAGVAGGGGAPCRLALPRVCPAEDAFPSLQQHLPTGARRDRGRGAAAASPHPAASRDKTRGFYSAPGRKYKWKT